MGTVMPLSSSSNVSIFFGLEILHLCPNYFTEETTPLTARGCPDTVAVRFARHAMGVAAYGHFKEVQPSWAAFVKVLEDLLDAIRHQEQVD